MASKFKEKLVEKIKEEEKERLHQNELQKKYNIKEDVVVVEKSNIFKFLTKTTIGLIRFLAAAIVFVLAIIGLAALLYPSTRVTLMEQANHTFNEILQLIS